MNITEGPLFKEYSRDRLAKVITREFRSQAAWNKCFGGVGGWGGAVRFIIPQYRDEENMLLAVIQFKLPCYLCSMIVFV